MPNDENKIILEFPATNVEIELGETITFDNISGFLDSGRVTYNGDSLTEEITHLENDKADTTYVNTELDKKADKTDTYTKTQVDNIANAKLDKANPTGTGSFSLNRKANTTIGYRSVATGYNTTASGMNAHSEGATTTASGSNSHSEGFSTTASGNQAHSEGAGTIASGNNSHSEGAETTASGERSHAEGLNTEAKGNNQHVSGKYNIVDNNNEYAEIIGNGTSSSARSNARTLDWQGNETLAGDVIINGNQSVSGEISRLDNRITDLPEAMVFKGTLGVGGTIETLPTASAENEGWTFKCITAGTYAGLTLKVGDTVTCFNPPNTSVYEWEKTGSQDTDTDTWRNIKVNGVEKLGNGISSGAVDFEDTANVKFEFDANGNKVRAKLDGIYTDSEVDDLLDDKADADNTYTKEQVNDIVYGILPDDTASGSVANFETDLALPLKSLEVDVNAVQSAGTPTPATPLPISGWSEINLYKLGGNFFNKNTVTNGKLINGSGNEVSYADWNTSDFIPVVDGASYYLYGLTAHPNTNQDNFELFNASKVKVGYANVKTNEQPYVIPSGVAYIKCCVKNQDIDTAQLGVSVNTSFVPYNPVIEKTVINLGGTYYGGHFTQDKAGHRRFEVTCAKEHISLQGKTYDTANGFDAWLVYLTNRSLNAGSSANKLCSVCSNYRYEGSSANIEHYYIASQAVVIYLAENTFRDGEFDIVYPLATPYVIDLPDGEPIATLVGTNNIFADTGDTSVVFKDSVNGYVEKKIANVQALVLNT